MTAEQLPLSIFVEAQSKFCQDHGHMWRLVEDGQAYCDVCKQLVPLRVKRSKVGYSPV